MSSESTSFNQDPSDWDTSKVATMSGMFLWSNKLQTKYYESNNRKLQELPMGFVLVWSPTMEQAPRVVRVFWLSSMKEQAPQDTIPVN